MTVGRATACAWQGDLAAAAEHAEEAIEAARLSGSAQSRNWALTLRCWVATLAGDLDLALSSGEEALATAGRLVRTHWGALTACYLAEAKLEAGDPEGCRDLLVPQLPLVERAFQTRWYELLTRAELAMGRLPAAQRHAACADATAHGLGLPARTSEALRARAAVLLAAGDTTGAARAAQGAAREAQRVGNRLDAARAQLLAGKALSGREATVALLDAEAGFADAGARRLRDEAARELRRRGRRVARQGARRPTRPENGVEALTDREREVAELLADGHTNRRIADQLHLSPKTVETHVAHIFEKLEVRSRAAVAAAIVRTIATA
jgi:DNA-binding NarL/FixJ family response regulator